MTCLSDQIIAAFPDSEMELSHFAKGVGIGRSTMFNLLKSAGWIQHHKPLPEEWAVREGLLSFAEKRCSSPEFSKVKFYTTSLTKKGCREMMTTLPQLVARIPEEQLRSKTLSRLCKAGFTDLFCETKQGL